MSTTTAPPLSLFEAEPVAVGHEDSVGALVLGEDATLALIGAERRAQDQAAARELRAVVHWLDLNTADPALLGEEVDAGPLFCGQPMGREGVLQLAGEGTALVDEFAVCQLATTLGLSETAARSYAGQTLELRERLPRLYRRVMDGELPAWKARQIAAETIPLNAAAACYVDAHLAPFAAKMSLGRILRAVNAAISRHDPAAARERAEKAAEGRGVWVDDDLDGTSRITAVTTTPDAAAFEAAVHQVAGDLATLGSTAPEQVRRATAVGVLADSQYALDLHTTAQAAQAAQAGAEPKRPPRRSTQGPTFHIHLHTDAVNGIAGIDGLSPVARVNGIGPEPLAVVEQWLTGLAPGTQIKITPVVDLTEHISVDAYEHSDPLRNQVDERDHGCRFPWCGRKGMFDIDHIDPYIPIDEGGPPGQTNTGNSAKLCRFHHRVKTHGRWRYQRTGPTTVLWISPHGRRYTVDAHGTTASD